MTFDPQKRRLDELLPAIKNGDIQLPEFQRNYVWKWGQRFHLLNSVQKGYPIGTLLFLETSSDSAGAIFKSRVVKGVDETGPAALKLPNELILDGQQRLTTLFQAFNKSSGMWYCIDLKELFTATGGQKGIDVEIEEFIKKQRASKSSQSTLHNKHLLPLFFALDDSSDRSLVEILFEYRSTLETSDLEYGEFVIKVLPSYLKQFQNYELPVVRLSRNLSISAIATIFTELNSTGQKLTAFDLCVAKFYPSGLNLRGLLEDTIAADSDFARLDPEGMSTLQAIALLKSLGGEKVNTKKAKLVEVLQADWVKDSWPEASQAISNLGKLMSATGFGSPKTTPYESVVPSLAVAAQELVKGGAKESDIKSRLKTFILATAFNLRYTEGTDAKRDVDVDDFITFVQKGKKPDHLNQIFNTFVLKSSSLSGARFSAFLGLLNGEPLKDFREDQEVGLGSSHKKVGEIHHIFPRKYLQTVMPIGDAKKFAEVTLNTTIVLPETNNLISDKQPSAYIDIIKKDLVSKGHCADEAAAENRLRSIMKDHLIDGDAFDCMSKDDYQGFLEARAKTLAEKLRSLGVQAEYSEALSSDDED